MFPDFDINLKAYASLMQDGGMNPAVGEPVTFRLAVNHAAVKAAAKAGGLAAAHAGRRATQVKEASDIRDLVISSVMCQAWLQLMLGAVLWRFRENQRCYYRKPKMLLG